MERTREILYKRQQETIDNIKRLVYEHGYCAMLRPTGFGKTYILANYIGEILKRTRNENV